MYRWLFQWVLRFVPAETAHHLGFAALRLAMATPGLGHALRRHYRVQTGQPIDVMGLRFAHPVLLAAGFDKNATGISALLGLGFAGVEVGTVTALPQPGNPKPRLFRLVCDRALLNRMGFNNDGAEVVAKRLHRYRARHPLGQGGIVGVNIGKSKVVPEEGAAADYAASARLLGPYADYLVINVSSPNTPGLRNLQQTARLIEIVAAVRGALQEVTARHVPLLVKVAPDLADAELVAIAEALTATALVDGLIATNTTISRQGLSTPEDEVAELGPGGLSGAPLAARSLGVLTLLASHVPPSCTLIAAGGIGPENVKPRLAAGASLVQVYTEFVYGGPGVIERLTEATMPD